MHQESKMFGDSPLKLGGGSFSSFSFLTESLLTEEAGLLLQIQNLQFRIILNTYHSLAILNVITSESAIRHSSSLIIKLSIVMMTCLNFSCLRSSPLGVAHIRSFETNRPSCSNGFLKQLSNRIPVPRACLVTDNQRTSTPSSVAQTKTTDSVHPERLDPWVVQSVKEIVSNRKNAPFLLCVYSKEGSEEKPRLEVVREASSENWSRIRWENDDSVPDGVILVEELADEEETCDRFLGIIAQGRKFSRIAGYVMKLTEIPSDWGFSTYFSLARVKSEEGPADAQLRNSWLVAC